MSKLKSLVTSNTAANVLLLATCAIVIWAVMGRQSSASPGAIEGVWPSGSLAPVPIALDAHWEQHVVIFVHSQCRYCSEEMDFYRSLQMRAGSSGTRFYAVSAEGAEVLEEYLKSNGLASFTSISGTSVPNLPATPTVLVADSRGVVGYSWRGVMNSKQKEQLRKLL